MNIQGSEMEFGDRFSYVTNDLKQYGIYEINSTALMWKNIKKTDMCVDVGAHIGYYTLIMAQKGMSVTAFEPSMYNYELLEKNVKLNNYKNVRLIPAAVSDENMTAELVENEKCTGMNYLSFIATSHAKTVPVNRLDTTFRHIDVLKIDVEGLETRVLRGMGKLRPRIILIEDYPMLRLERGDDPKEMYVLLSDYNCVKADNNLFCMLKRDASISENMSEHASVVTL